MLQLISFKPTLDSHLFFSNKQRRAEDEHGSIGSVGSIDDDMLDITVSHDVMTKPPSREVSREEQQPTRRQPEASSDVNPDGMPLNIIS